MLEGCSGPRSSLHLSGSLWDRFCWKQIWGAARGSRRLEETEAAVYAGISDVHHLPLPAQALRPHAVLLRHAALYDPCCVCIRRAQLGAAVQMLHDGAMEQPVREQGGKRGGASAAGQWKERTERDSARKTTL
jgi:hypothetical protein